MADSVHSFLLRFHIGPPVVLAAAFLVASCSRTPHQPDRRPTSDVHYTGAMRNVMWRGELAGTIDLDTIADKSHLYGVGPVEFLTGEITLLDGEPFVAAIAADSTLLVKKMPRIKAPFFVYANVGRWTESSLPDSVRSLPTLEHYLDRITATARRPFAFRLSGRIDSAVVHVVNLPRGSAVHSPDDAHRGERIFHLPSSDADIVGFFSTQHQGIFTHHDTYLHMHLITANRSAMGHLERASFSPGAVKLFLPAE